MLKREITGKAVIYTKDGVKVVDAEVRRSFNVHQDSCKFRFNFPEEYLLIGGARTIKTSNSYAMPAYDPDKIQRAINYGKSKFFRLVLDFMRLARWNPLDKSNVPLDYQAFYCNEYYNKTNIDYSKQGTDLDAELFKHYQFTPSMIRFTEERYQ